jgi:hypothetical protein
LPIPVIPATHSGRSRPPVPEEAGHLFRRKSATCSGRSRPPIPEEVGHPSERSDAGVKYFSDFYEFVKLDFFCA